MGARALAFGGLLAAAFAFPATGMASQLVDRNATAVKLAVTSDGKAIVSYRAGGRAKQVIVSGAVNALAPTKERPQVVFKVRYVEGAKSAARVAKAAGNLCAPYDGPHLKWLVAACKAPDGSYWALQRWQRALPNYGLRPTAKQSAWELRVSHWTGELPALNINLGWAYDGKFEHLAGSLAYRGIPVYGFRSTKAGVPLDSYGRNLYVDTLNSAYGSGWRRENSFLTRGGTGTFCYGFYPHGSRPPGNGQAYRITVIGPGVTPDITWEGKAPGAYNRERERTRAAIPVSGGNDQRLCPK